MHGAKQKPGYWHQMCRIHKSQYLWGTVRFFCQGRCDIVPRNLKWVTGNLNENPRVTIRSHLTGKTAGDAVNKSAFSRKHEYPVFSWKMRLEEKMPEQKQFMCSRSFHIYNSCMMIRMNLAGIYSRKRQEILSLGKWISCKKTHVISC